MRQFFTQILFIILVVCLVMYSFGQGVAINTTKTPPNSSAMLDIGSTNKGLLIPRLNLKNLNDKLTIKDPANALLVFNTNPAILGGEGFFYNRGTFLNPEWMKLLENADLSTAWLRGGNDNITTNDFIGTTTEQDIVFKWNGKEAFRIRRGAALFTGDESIGIVPTAGLGTRMMYVPALEGAFRVGHVTNTQWNQENTGKGSFASGYNTVASGDYSFASGYNATASGHVSFALGYNATASKDFAFAMGNFVSAKNISAISTGDHTIAEGMNAASFNNSTTAHGNNSAAFNANTYANGDNSFAIGFKTTAVFDNTFSQGESTIAKAKNSAAFGVGTVANARHSFVLGTYNDITPVPLPDIDEGGSEYTDRIFEIGSGSDKAHRSNAMTVLRSGATSIGSANPVAMLDIAKTSQNNSKELVRLKDYNDDDYYTMDIMHKNEIHYFDFNNNCTSGFYRFLTNPSGNFNKLLMEISSAGIVTAADFQATSDIRLKKNIEPLKNVLEKLQNIQPIYYNLKTNAEEGIKNRHIGFSAQEMQKQFPELVKENEQGFLSVGYANVTAVLLQAIKEQQLKIEKLEKEKQEQKNINALMLQRIEKLEVVMQK